MLRVSFFFSPFSFCTQKLGIFFLFAFFGSVISDVQCYLSQHFVFAFVQEPLGYLYCFFSVFFSFPFLFIVVRKHCGSLKTVCLRCTFSFFFIYLLSLFCRCSFLCAWSDRECASKWTERILNFTCRFFAFIKRLGFYSRFTYILNSLSSFWFRCPFFGLMILMLAIVLTWWT